MSKSTVLLAVAALGLASAGVRAAAVSDLYAGGAGSYALTGTVTAVLNANATANSFVLQDATGGTIAFNIPRATYAATVGDNVTVTATNSPYQSGPELVASGFTATVNSTGNTFAAPLVTIPQFKSAGDGTSALAPMAETIVTLHDVYLPAGTTSLATAANTNYTLTDADGNSVTYYDYKSDSACVAAATAANAANDASGGTLFAGPLDITGFVDVYYGTPEIYAINFAPAAAAIPEPASLGLLGAGALALAARRTRRA